MPGVNASPTIIAMPSRTSASAPYCTGSTDSAISIPCQLSTIASSPSARTRIASTKDAIFGADPYPSSGEARSHQWTEEERALVVDRVDTQVVGSPATVVEQLDRIVEVTGADEVVVTTMTHGHADRVRSYALLAEHWHRWP